MAIHSFWIVSHLSSSCVNVENVAQTEHTHSCNSFLEKYGQSFSANGLFIVLFPRFYREERSRVDHKSGWEAIIAQSVPRASSGGLKWRLFVVTKESKLELNRIEHNHLFKCLAIYIFNNKYEWEMIKRMFKGKLLFSPILSLRARPNINTYIYVCGRNGSKINSRPPTISIHIHQQLTNK
jgi:hypothetical protein